MDVNLLSRLLKELIIDNDRIPLPGMGYFQTEPMPAFFSEDGKTIYPPSKRISFKGDERAAGDMISRYYAGISNIDPDTAATELDAFLRQLKVTLSERRNIDLPGLGKLRCTLEGNFYFVAEQDGGIFSQAFGFEPVTLRPVRPSVATAAPIEESGSGQMTILPEKANPDPVPTAAAKPDNHSKKGYRILFIILAVLAVLIIAAVILVELGRSGKLDRLIYTEEELELIEQQGL